MIGNYGGKSTLQLMPDQLRATWSLWLLLVPEGKARWF